VPRKLAGQICGVYSSAAVRGPTSAFTCPSPGATARIKSPPPLERSRSSVLETRIHCDRRPKQPMNWGCPADLLTNQTVLNPKVHGHTSRAPPVGIEPTSPPTQAVALPTKPQIPYLCVWDCQPRQTPSGQLPIRLDVDKIRCSANKY
jgi:hypothetical protein